MEILNFKFPFYSIGTDFLGFFLGFLGEEIQFIDFFFKKNLFLRFQFLAFLAKSIWEKMVGLN